MVEKAFSMHLVCVLTQCWRIIGVIRKGKVVILNTSGPDSDQMAEEIMCCWCWLQGERENVGLERVFKGHPTSARTQGMMRWEVTGYLQNTAYRAVLDITMGCVGFYWEILNNILFLSKSASFTCSNCKTFLPLPVIFFSPKTWRN